MVHNTLQISLHSLNITQGDYCQIEGVGPIAEEKVMDLPTGCGLRLRST